MSSVLGGEILAERTEVLTVHAEARKDGKVTVTVRLIGWDPGVLTSLQQRPTLKSRISSRIALAVYEIFGESD